MSILKKCYDFTRVDEAKAVGIYPYFPEIEKVEGNYVWVDGKKIIMIGSNNYLGLYDDQRIKDASIEAVKKFGSSTCGSRFLNGTYSLHVDLEKKISEFMGKEDTIMFSTGSWHHSRNCTQERCYYNRQVGSRIYFGFCKVILCRGY